MIANELKLFNRKNSRANNDGSNTREGTVDKSSWKNPYSEHMSPTGVRKTNASVYSVRNPQIRKTTNKTRSSSSTNRLDDAHKKRKQTPYNHATTTVPLPLVTVTTSDEVMEASDWLSFSNVSSNRVSLVDIERDDFRTNRSEAKGEWSGRSFFLP